MGKSVKNQENQNNVDDLHKANQDEFVASEDNPKEEPAKAEGSKKAPANTSSNEVTELKNQLAELDDQYKRLLADYQNMTKRLAREREEAHKYAASNTVEMLLPALDNFEFAKKSLTENNVSEDLIKNIDMLREQILAALKSIGLEIIDTNRDFDPVFHEAISRIKDDSKKEGTIVEVVKQGYKLKDRVVRPASVVVSTKEG